MLSVALECTSPECPPRSVHLLKQNRDHLVFFCFSRYLPRGVLHGERDGVRVVKTLEQGPTGFDLGFSQNRGMMSEDTEYASPECLLASVNPLGQLRDLLIFSVFEVSPRGVLHGVFSTGARRCLADECFQQGPIVLGLGFLQNRRILPEEKGYTSPECLLASVQLSGHLRAFLVFPVFRVSPTGCTLEVSAVGESRCLCGEGFQQGPDCFDLWFSQNREILSAEVGYGSPEHVLATSWTAQRFFSFSSFSKCLPRGVRCCAYHGRVRVSE
ncbi:MAG: uncharacterized protein A8A55_2632 [Amphiamblys sp. WSBS2006]|nr:MAG: uncharacterized protein A8A55_2632 [Amphiamblys sp. WSBS2006]